MRISDWSSDVCSSDLQRFAYDDVLTGFDNYFSVEDERTFVCPNCATVYKESELYIGGTSLRFCPRDRTDLKENAAGVRPGEFTEEEVKIIGTEIGRASGRERVCRYV